MKIAVIMSVYNGEKYIREQIGSILAQKGVDVHIFVRDDGSKDSTPDILREYQENHPDRFSFVNSKNIVNYGVKKSFLGLLKYVYDRHADMEYFCFADQDDYWLEDKLSAAVELLEAEPDNPKGKLYYSNKTFVDQELKLIKEEDITYYGDLTEVFWHSLVSGCVMVWDRKLTEYAVRHFPKVECIHDSWIYRLAKIIGSAVVFDKNSYIQYRQHTNNVLGMDVLRLHHDEPSFLLKRIIPVLFVKRTYFVYRFIMEIFDVYRDDIPEENARLLKVFKGYKFNPVSKIRMIFNREMLKRPLKTRLVWAYSIIFNRY